MSLVEVREDWKTIRARLRNPPNAVPDYGIDLKRKPNPKATLVEKPAPASAFLAPVWFHGPVIQLETVWRRPDGSLKITIQSIIRTVSRFYEVPVSDIVGMRRNAGAIKPRHVAMYLAKRFTTHSLPAIGIQFSGRDHTTVLSAIRKIERKRAVDPELNNQIERLSEKFVFTE